MKPWYQSRTLWAALLTGIVGIATVVVGEGLVSVQAAGGIMVAVGLLNSVLRMLTSEELKL